MDDQPRNPAVTFRSRAEKIIFGLSPYQLLFVSAISIFLANGSLEYFEHRIAWSPSDPQVHGIIVSFFLFLMVFPPLYLFSYRPLARRLEEQKIIHDQVSEAELHYRTLFDHLPIGAIVFDPDTRRPIHFNGALCWQLGHTRDEFEKMTINDFEAVERPEETKRHIDKILRDGRDIFETKHRTKSGEIRDVEVTARVVRVGGRDCILGVFLDITSHKREVEAMRRCGEVERMASLGRLGAGVAHEINNALAGVLGMAELLRMGKVQGDEVDIIIHEGRRAAKVAQDLLMFSRPHPPNMQVVDLPALIRQVDRIVSKELRLRNVVIDIQAPDTILPVMADESQMHQVFINLIFNARDAMPSGGQIDIGFRVKGKFVQIEVGDTGSGIPEDHLPRIFDPFFTTKEKGKGTGLGLSVVYGILHAHGGMIVASNRGDRPGAVFSMILPVAAIESSPDVQKPDGDAPKCEGVLSILVVEDESYIRQYCERIIESAGHRAVLATTLDEAMRVLETGAFDIVLCDQFLSGRRGLDLLAALRSQQRPEAGRFILMTGASPAEIDADVEIIFKPFDPARLMKFISRVAGTPAARQDVAS